MILEKKTSVRRLTIPYDAFDECSIVTFYIIVYTAELELTSNDRLANVPYTWL